ncbi:uncharacterized protein [Clytia hemisphaerica]|uniref:Uncharacterized protein n=1 Tax=Clytia hemisphaerica TaxID=252671 RepID=A0A7M5TVV3_9CNID|eukprot:TCONS_00011093-protein
MADFYSNVSSIDDKIKNSLSSTSLAFQQTFLSKSMPDLQAIKAPLNKPIGGVDDGEINLPDIAPATAGVMDSQPPIALNTRRKSYGDLNDIKFFNSESSAGDPSYGHQAQFQPELQEGVDRLLIKKRSILNEIQVPQYHKGSRKDIQDFYNQEENEFESKRNSNLKELTSLMVKKSPRKLTIAEEYQKLQLESKMQDDIRRAQSIFNSTHKERIDACQTNRDGMDSLDSARKIPEPSQPVEESKPEPIDVDALINNRGPVSRNIEEENNKLLELLKNDRQAEPEPSIVGFTKTYEPEEQIPQYSNRDLQQLGESPVASPVAREEKENGDGKPYYPIKMYVKQPKQKDKVGKRSDNKGNKKAGAGGGSYADLANRKSTKKQPVTNKTKKTKRKVQSAGGQAKPKEGHNNKSKVGEARGEVKSALESTGPFCKCSDEEDGGAEEPIDAKHTLDYPIVRPVFNGNYIFGGAAEEPQYYQPPGGPQATFMAPQALPSGGFYIPQQTQYAPQDMAPSRGNVNGNLYFAGSNDPYQQQPAPYNANFDTPSMSDKNNNRYDDCPMAQNYFNKFAAVQTFQSEYLNEIKNQPKPPVMPKLPVGLHNPSIDMMHTPIESGIYTTKGQEFLPPVPGHQIPIKQERFSASNEYTRMSSPQNTSSGYSTDEGYGERQPVKPKQRITKSFSQNSAEELQDEIIRKNKVMRQKQYSETIRQHQKSSSPKPQVPSWNMRSRDDEKNYNESKRAAALQYAKSVQSEPRTAPLPPPATIKPSTNTTTPSDYDQLLKSIEEMKQRHEQDKVAVDQLTAGRPQPKK